MAELLKKLSNFELMKEIGERAKKSELGFSNLDMETDDKEERNQERKLCLMTFYWLCVKMETEAIKIEKEDLIGENGDYKDIGWYCGRIAQMIKENEQRRAVKDAYNRGFEAGKKEKK